MYSFIKRFANGVFFPEEVQILIAAFDDAWAKLQSSRAPFAEEAYAPAAREILAKHIIMAAQRGERNPRRLTDDALLYLSRQRPRPRTGLLARSHLPRPTPQSCTWAR